MIAHARHDERGQYSGGKAGDQDGTEVAITEWYDRPWTHVLRCKDSVKRELIARCAEGIANNPNIGYDQGQRLTLYNVMKKVKFDPLKVTEPVECDCSSMVAVCCRAAGIDVDPDLYTGSERQLLMDTGLFHTITGEILKDPDQALRGDIWLYEFHHTAVNTTYGKRVHLYPVGWNRDNIGWWYADTPNTFPFSCWRLINERWYYFNDRGYAVKGMYVIDGKRYYFSEKNDTEQCQLMRTDNTGALYPWIVK